MLLKSLDLTKTFNGYEKNLNRNNAKKIDDLKQLEKIDGKHLIFSPLLGKLHLLDDEAKKILDNGFLDEFVKEGLFVSRTSNFFPKPTYDTNLINIFLTTKCNLRCIYCYAYGGETNKSISFDFVKVGIEEIIKNRKKLHIAFHGGGEQTLEFNLMKKIVGWTKTKIDDLELSIQTNGVFSQRILDWLIDNKMDVGLSADGPPYVQDAQRPLIGNRKSSNTVERTINRLVEANHSFGVRSTISAFSVDKQDEIVEYFYNLGVKKLAFEPLFYTGRSLKNSSVYSRPPKLTLFVKNFLKAIEFAEDCNIELTSTFNSIQGPRCYFCGASGQNFSLTTDGYITSCHDTPLGNFALKDFIYGKFDSKTKEIEIFRDKLKNLRSRIVQNMPDCQDCFLKWNCAGGCHSKTLLSTGNMFKPPKKRCDARREITKKYFVYLTRKKVLGKKPMIIRGKKAVYKSFFNRIELDKMKDRSRLRYSSYITMHLDKDRADLQKISRQIIRIKERNRYKPTFFALDFDLKEKDLSGENGKKIVRFLEELNENRIHYKLASGLPLCLFKHNHNKIVQDITRPESNKIISDNKNDHEKFKKCNNCIYLIRKQCVFPRER